MRNLKLLSSDVNDTSVSGLQRFLVLDALAEWIFFATKAQVFSFSLKDNKVNGFLRIFLQLLYLFFYL